MKREIKFRFWDCKKKEMSKPKELEHLPAKYKKYVYTPMQYTGLKDKNGLEIYEGDIVTCSMSFQGGVLPHMGEILYDDDYGAFGTKNLSGVTLMHNHCIHTMEIIGNIYENPDIIKQLDSTI